MVNKGEININGLKRAVYHLFGFNQNCSQNTFISNSHKLNFRGGNLHHTARQMGQEKACPLYSAGLEGKGHIIPKVHVSECPLP